MNRKCNVTNSKGGSSRVPNVIKSFNYHEGPKLNLWKATLDLITSNCVINANPECDIFINRTLTVNGNIFALKEPVNQVSPASITAANIAKIGLIPIKQFTIAGEPGVKFAIDFATFSAVFPGLVHHSTDTIDLTGLIALLIAKINSHHP